MLVGDREQLFVAFSQDSLERDFPPEKNFCPPSLLIGRTKGSHHHPAPPPLHHQNYLCHHSLPSLLIGGAKQPLRTCSTLKASIDLDLLNKMTHPKCRLGPTCDCHSRTRLTMQQKKKGDFRSTFQNYKFSFSSTFSGNSN